MQSVTSVVSVDRADTSPFILDIHYAGRFPSVSKAFGLLRDGELEGIVTYGTPPSSPLRSGVCGPSLGEHVIELNRLVLLNNYKNDASKLVGRSLKMLGEDSIVVSYADTSENHVGLVYQATNFLYCGLSAKRTDWVVKGKEHLHGQTIADEFRGCANRANLMREKYGDRFYLKDRPRKHRYVTFVGSRKFKAVARKSLHYPVEPYPKHY